MRCKFLSILIASLLTTTSYAENYVDSGLNSYLRMRQEYRENEVHEQNRQLQRQQLELQRQQLEILKEADRRDQVRHELERKTLLKQKENNESEMLTQKIKKIINERAEADWSLFVVLYPQYNDPILKGTMVNMINKIMDENPDYTKLDKRAFEIYEHAHKAILKSFGLDQTNK